MNDIEGRNHKGFSDYSRGNDGEYSAWRDPESGNIYLPTPDFRWLLNGNITFDSEKNVIMQENNWKGNNSDIMKRTKEVLKKDRLNINKMERIKFRIKSTGSNADARWKQRGYLPTFGYGYLGLANHRKWCHLTVWPLSRNITSQIVDIQVLQNKSEAKSNKKLDEIKLVEV